MSDHQTDPSVTHVTIHSPRSLAYTPRQSVNNNSPMPSALSPRSHANIPPLQIEAAPPEEQDSQTSGEDVTKCDKITSRIFKAIESIVLKLLSKLIGLSPPPSPK